ncbi:MAG: recombination mediator RecR [Saprospiraceae bacterium]
MNFSSKHLENAVDAFACLPGVGRKSALRLALHLLQQPTEHTQEFVESLSTMRREVRECGTCNNLSDSEICTICANPQRKQGLICVVENVRQVMAIEETGHYHGLYHVLGGVISPIDGIGPQHLNIEGLISRVEQAKETPEIILAISPTIEGETTNLYISKQLEASNPVISTIARGVSFGNDLEYADELTLSRSISARLPYATQHN